MQFRDRKTSASLKQIVLLLIPIRRWAIPRSKDLGLIEAQSLSTESITDFRIPRSKDLGLIEAERNAARWSSSNRIPRSKDLGLIEAQQRSASRLEYKAQFRDRKTSASLKHRRDCPARQHRRSIPRSKDLGLIEAGRQWFEAKTVLRIPRSKDLGLIEAKKFWTDPLLTGEFRDRKTSASLKLDCE